jgi:hypothetical protein
MRLAAIGPTLSILPAAAAAGADPHADTIRRDPDRSGRIVRGEIWRPGVIPPELLGAEAGVLERLLAELAERGVVYRASTEPM